jgi:hypothetical protein
MRLRVAVSAPAPGSQQGGVAHMPKPQATIHRLRPRNRKQAEAIRETLEQGGWSEPTRIELNQRLTIRSPEAETWSFVMLAAKPELMAAFLQAIQSGPRAHATLATWLALAPYVRRDTGEVVCSQRTLAKTASITQADVFYALGRLVEIGALLREGRGQYRVHPSVIWKGELVKRERAEAVMPKLELVKEERGAE